MKTKQKIEKEEKMKENIVIERDRKCYMKLCKLCRHCDINIKTTTTTTHL